MDDDVYCEPPERYLRPETDLTEGNAFRDGTEDLTGRPPAPDDRLWWDPEFGPVVLP